VEVIVTLEDLEGLENQIKFFRKSVYHNSVLSPMDVAKSSLKDLNLSKLWSFIKANSNLDIFYWQIKEIILFKYS